MIFDSAKVTKLVQEWKISKDRATLEQILIETRPLASYIASQHKDFEQEDMVQEALLKVCSALEVYDSSISNPHTYFATVIKNVCSSYVTRESRHNSIELEDETKGITYEYIVNDTLDDLIERNRIRFPTIPVEIIDSITEHIYYGMRDEIPQNKTLNNIVRECVISRAVASIVYNSTIIYLRNKYFQPSYNRGILDLEEVSLLPDLLDILGPDTFEQVRVIFNKITLRL